MRIDVSGPLKHIGQEMPFRRELTLRDQEFMGEDIHFTGDALMQGVMIGSTRGVTLSGGMTVSYTRPCSMCLEPIAEDVELEFEDDFLKEIDPEDPNDLFAIEDYSVDLTAYAESLVFLNMPMTVKCRTDCRGLCPICGHNLNLSQCSCDRADTPSSRSETDGVDEDYPTQRPFAALQDLLSRNEEV